MTLASLITKDTSGIVDQIATPLLRVVGMVLARLADAVIAAYVQDVEFPADDTVPASVSQRPGNPPLGGGPNPPGS